MTDTREATPRPWAAEANLPYGDQPRVYGIDGRLVAVFGNAEGDQDRWEKDAALAVRAVNHFDEVVRVLRLAREGFEDYQAEAIEIDAILSKLEASHGSA